MSRREKTVRSRAQIPGPSSQADHDEYVNDRDDDGDPPEQEEEDNQDGKSENRQ